MSPSNTLNPSAKYPAKPFAVILRSISMAKIAEKIMLLYSTIEVNTSGFFSIKLLFVYYNSTTFKRLLPGYDTQLPYLKY